MYKLWIGSKPDFIARLETMAFAEHCDNVLPAELGGDLNFRAGRLDHLDHRLRTVIGNGEVLGPNAINRWPAARCSRRRRERQVHIISADEFGLAVAADRTFEEIHGGRTDEAGD